MNNKILTCCIFSLILFYNPTLQALTLNVDVNDVSCDDTVGTPYCDVKIAVLDASSGDTIVLAPGYYTGTVVINKHLTITGAGSDSTFIEGGALGRRAIKILGIPVDSSTPFITTVTMSGLAIQKGRDAADGGGILNAGDLTLSNCVVTDNTSSTSGGGIYSSGGVSTKLVIDNCVISNNTSEAIGSASTPATQGGGGIYSLGTLIMQNSQILNNHANDHAGGIYIDNTNFASTAVIENSYFYNNTGSFVGAIYNNGSVTITNSAFDYNRGTTTQSVGGAIANEYIGNLYVTNSTFTRNRSTLRGGAIYHNGTGYAYIYNSTIADNATGIDYGRGGGIFFSSGGSVYIKNTLLSNNTASPSYGSDCGGTIVSQGYNLITNADLCDIVSTDGDLFGTTALAIDAKLDVFADNGGPINTHALIEGSPAINAGDVAGCTDTALNPLSSDQRGFPRPEFGTDRCDIGAYEGSVAAPSVTTPVSDGTTSPTDTTSTTEPTTSSSGGGAISFFMFLLAPLISLLRFNVVLAFPRTQS